MASFAAELTTRLLRYERVLIACTVVLLAAFGWAFLLRPMPMQSAPPPLTALITMWWLMMLAMMLPSATPALLLYARVRETRDKAAIAQTWVFLAGYLSVWLVFSIAAAAFQLLVARSSMVLQSRAAQTAVLILAGVYQLSPLKSACIRQCRSPAQFISRYWRPGLAGAVRLGVFHGAYCVGCCWMLMALLFVGGVMNLLWVICLTVMVAAEKLLPPGLQIPKVSGVALLLWALLRILK